MTLEEYYKYAQDGIRDYDVHGFRCKQWLVLLVAGAVTGMFYRPQAKWALAIAAAAGTVLLFLVEMSFQAVCWRLIKYSKRLEEEMAATPGAQVTNCGRFGLSHFVSLSKWHDTWRDLCVFLRDGFLRVRVGFPYVAGLFVVVIGAWVTSTAGIGDRGAANTRSDGIPPSPSSMPVGVAASPPDAVARVEQYYQHAFSNLVAVLVVGLAVVGIIMPLVLERVRSQSFQREREDLRRELGERINAATQKYEGSLKQLLEQNRRQVNHHSAIHWYEMAKAIIKTQGSAWPHAIRYWCFAINSALAAQWEPTEPKWGWLLNCLDKFQGCEPAKGVAKMPEIRESLLETICALRQLPQVPPYSTLREKLEWLLELNGNTQGEPPGTGTAG